jgi:hypothetical protein
LLGACREGWSAIDIGRVERPSTLAASSTSGPDGPRELSAREKKILAEIENELLVADPTLARHLECAHWPRAESQRRAVARHRALLIPALIILITAATAVPSGWWGALQGQCKVLT